MLIDLVVSFSYVLERLKYLESLHQHSFKSVDDSHRAVLPEWKRNRYEVGEIVFVKRRLWKNASGFSTNAKKKGHPGVVTVTSKKDSNTFMLVPGTSGAPIGQSFYFSPKEKIEYFKGEWDTKRTSFVLDYWRSVSRNGPFKIGKLCQSDRVLLQDKMIEVHRLEYINLAFKQ